MNKNLTILVAVFWLAHFVASIFAVGFLLVAPLHPEEFTESHFIAAQVILFPMFNITNGAGSLLFLSAINSILWSSAIYGVAFFLGSRKAKNAQQPL